jgi:hypothetical protein
VTEEAVASQQMQVSERGRYLRSDSCPR